MVKGNHPFSWPYFRLVKYGNLPRYCGNLVVGLLNSDILLATATPFLLANRRTSHSFPAHTADVWSFQQRTGAKNETLISRAGLDFQQIGSIWHVAMGRKNARLSCQILVIFSFPMKPLEYCSRLMRFPDGHGKKSMTTNYVDIFSETPGDDTLGRSGISMT